MISNSPCGIPEQVLRSEIFVLLVNQQSLSVPGGLNVRHRAALSCSILVLPGQPASPIPAMLQRLWHRNKCGTSWGRAATSKVLAIESPAFRARHVTITCIVRGHHVSGRYPNVATARLTVDFCGTRSRRCSRVTKHRESLESPRRQARL